MINRTWTFAAGLTLIAALTALRPLQGQVTYIDASVTNTVGAISGEVDWNDGDDTTNTNGTANNDGLWRFRNDQGSNGIWEATGANAHVEDAVELKTTMSGVIDGTYEILLFYHSSTNGNWPIRAGFTSHPNMNPVYDQTGELGIAGTDVALSGLTFTGTPPAANAAENLLFASLGELMVTGGSFSVFVDDLPASGSNNRTWYDGIGYRVPVPPVLSVMSGLASSPSTWSNNEPPSAGNLHKVVSGHTVTVDGPFAGKELRATSGGTVSFNSGGSAAFVPRIVIDDGGNLTETASGDFALGDIFQEILGTLELNNTAPVEFAIDAGANFYLDMSVTGTGDLNFTGAAGSTLWLSETAGHDGVIRFEGAGDRVMITEANAGVGTLEMNSTGANTVFFDPRVQSDNGTIVFNQPGTIDHAATQVEPNVRRLHGASTLVANADVVVDLSKPFPGDERRLLVGVSLEGSANITVNGMSSDPTDGSGISLNEFEFGSTGDVIPPTSEYAGVMTLNDYVNLELRHNLPNARIVINNNARMDSGLQTVPTVGPGGPELRDIEVGEIVVNNGGILEVGFEQFTSGSGFYQQTGHQVGHLVLTENANRGGDLTLSGGATLRMQINGTAIELFDRITVQGDVVLDGTLDLLISPPSSDDEAANASYTPNVGDVFDIITLAGGSAGAADFDDSGTIDGADLDIWEGAFGVSNAAGDTDGDMDTDGADFLVWQRSLGSGAGPLGTITGDFDTVNVIDPAGLMAGKTFNVVKTGSAVQLVVASAVAAIPEPAGTTLAALAALGLAAATRRHRPLAA